MNSTQLTVVIQIAEMIHTKDLEWFEPHAITSNPGGGSTITAQVVDHAELYGLINKLRDFNLSLISVLVSTK